MKIHNLLSFRSFLPLLFIAIVLFILVSWHLEVAEANYRDSLLIDLKSSKEVSLFRGKQGAAVFKVDMMGFRIPDPENTVVLSTQSQTQSFQNKLSLFPKGPCLCSHMYYAIFSCPTKKILVSFCDHCFDIENDGTQQSKVSHFRPSKEFSEYLFGIIGTYTGL